MLTSPYVVGVVEERVFFGTNHKVKAVAPAPGVVQRLKRTLRKLGGIDSGQLEVARDRL